MNGISEMTDWVNWGGFPGKSTTRIDEAGLLAHLRTKVKGQDTILQDQFKRGTLTVEPANSNISPA
jgi:hypothetical protein